MPIVKWSKRAIDALVPPKTKQVILWDTEVKGFGLRIMASGIKTFVVQYRNAEGIKRRMNLGRFGVLTVDQARDLRSEEHTSELQSLMRISYAVFCLKKKTTHTVCKSLTVSEY